MDKNTVVMVLIAGVSLWVLWRWRSRSHEASNGSQPNADAEVLTRLASSGSDLSKPHSVDFFLDFPTQQGAERSAEELRAEGFDANATSAGEGKGWTCTVKKDLVPVLSTIETIGKRLELLAKTHGGVYDGWGASVES